MPTCYPIQRKPIFQLCQLYSQRAGPEHSGPRFDANLQSMFLHLKRDTNGMKRVPAIQGKYDKDALTFAVIRLSDGFVFLLTGSVPDLHFDFNSIDLDNFIYKIESYGHHVIVRKGIFSEPQENVALANTRVANDDYLLNVIEWFLYPRLIF